MINVRRSLKTNNSSHLRQRLTSFNCCHCNAAKAKVSFICLVCCAIAMKLPVMLNMCPIRLTPQFDKFLSQTSSQHVYKYNVQLIKQHNYECFDRCRVLNAIHLDSLCRYVPNDSFAWVPPKTVEASKIDAVLSRN